MEVSIRFFFSAIVIFLVFLSQRPWVLWGDVQAGGKEGSINAALLCLSPGSWEGRVWGSSGLGKSWEFEGAAGSGGTLERLGSLGVWGSCRI